MAPGCTREWGLRQHATLQPTRANTQNWLRLAGLTRNVSRRKQRWKHHPPVLPKVPAQHHQVVLALLSTRHQISRVPARVREDGRGGVRTSIATKNRQMGPVMGDGNATNSNMEHNLAQRGVELVHGACGMWPRTCGRPNGRTPPNRPRTTCTYVGGRR